MTSKQWYTERRPYTLHVGIIPDGMRRWAKQHHIGLAHSYLQALNLLERSIDFFFSDKADILSIYLMTADNLNRTPEEVTAILDAIRHFCNGMLPRICDRWECRFRAAGEVESLGVPILTDAVKQLEIRTAGHHARKIYACINYDPLTDLSQALRHMERKDVRELLNKLHVKEPMDLCIRTGKKNRLTMFLPLHLSYSDIYFIDKYFLDVGMEDYEKIWADFRDPEKIQRFGK